MYGWSRNKWVQTTLSTVGFLICVILLAYSVGQKNNRSALATLKFNLESLAKRDLTLGDIPVASIIAPATSSIISEAEDTVASIVDALIPQNCTIGLKQFCIGYARKSVCARLPLGLPNIQHLPVPQKDWEQLSYSLKHLTTPVVYFILLIELIWSGLVVFVVFHMLLYQALTFCQGMLILLTVVALALPLVALSAILWTLQSKRLPVWVEMEPGPVMKVAPVSVVFFGLGVIMSAVSLMIRNRRG